MGTGAWKRFLFPFLYRAENEQNLVSSARICYYLRGIFDFEYPEGEHMEKYMETDLRYLKSLANQYPTVAAAATEIINLEAILSLPKGTEHFHYGYSRGVRGSSSM